MSKTTKTGRIELRTEDRVERRLRFAAELSNQSLSAFILEAASTRAEVMIASSKTTSVPSEFFDALWSALESPPQANAALQRRARAKRRVLQRG